MNNKKYLSLAVVLGGLLSLALISPALAQTVNPANPGGQARNGQTRTFNGQRLSVKPAVIGTVTAVSGSTITINSRPGLAMMGRRASTTPPVTPQMPPAAVYTINASNATVMKDGATSTISSILVGDNILVQGTVSGTNVTATLIRDAKILNRGNGQEDQGKKATTSPIVGNGEPVIAGTVSVINGNNLSITNKSNITYAIDVTNARFTQGQKVITLTDIKVGDAVVIQGTVNGTSVIATSVIDQKKINQNNQTGTSTQAKPKANPGFFGRIGGFFSHMFGF